MTRNGPRTPKHMRHGLLLTLLVGATTLSAQTPVADETPVTQDFDAMGTSANLPANWRIRGNNGSTNWSDGLLVTTQQAHSGTPASGGTYNWGSSASERALGTMTSGSIASPTHVFWALENTGATPIDGLSVEYVAERYRRNSAAASISFHFSLDGTSWTPVAAGDIPASEFPTGSSTYYMASPQTVVVPAFNIGDLTIPVGGKFYLRWAINTTGSSSQGIGIDDVSLSASFMGTPGEPFLALGSIAAPPAGCIAAVSGNSTVNVNALYLGEAPLVVSSNSSAVELALDAAGPYAASVEIEHSGSSNATVHLRFTPATVGTTTATLTLSGGGSEEEATASVSFNGLDTPPSVTTGSSDAIGSYGATLHGTLTAEGCQTVTTQGFVYSTVADFTGGSGTELLASSGTNYSAALSGLAPCTTYYVRAFATSGSGTTYGTITSFTTEVLAAPLALAATGVSHNGFTAHWEAVEGATGYRLDVSEHEAFGILQPGTTTLENFANLPASATNYATRIWTGTNGVEWTATLARTDQTIAPNGRAVTFQGTNGASLTSGDIAGGVTSISFDALRAFGTTNGIFTVSVLSGPAFATVTTIGTQTYTNTVSSFSSTFAQIQGPVRIRIVSNGGERASLNNLSFTRADALVPNLVSGYADLAVSGTEHAVSSLPSGGSYYYRLRAVGPTCLSDNSATIPVEVPVCEPIVIATIGSNGPICSDGELTLSATLTGSDPYLVEWSGTGTIFNAGSLEASVAGAASGTYTLTAINDCGEDEATVEVEVMPLQTWYADADGDGAGDPDDSVEACLAPEGYVADNSDLCPTDGNKTVPGVCGCGVADTDSDGDGTPDCNDACPSDPNKTEPGVCGCGVADTDSDGDGTPDCNDECPNDPNKTEPGACGCGVADTDSDGDGTPDCNDECPYLPGLVNGDSCDDGDPNTGNDTVVDCVCSGQVVDCLGVPGGSALPGTACDDGDALTENDMWTAECNCAGEPIEETCDGQEVVIRIHTDGQGHETTWTIRDHTNGTVVASGGPYTGQNNELIITTVCLPNDALADYRFRLQDAGGNGFSAGSGYWELADATGRVFLRDDHTGTNDGYNSPSMTPAFPTYGTGHPVVLPLGNGTIAATSCGRMDLIRTERITANEIPGASNYQFEFANPDAGFTRRIAVPRTWVRLNEMVTSPLVNGVTYFTRVRGDLGVPGFQDDRFGAGCELALVADPTCTSLVDNPGSPTHSCGVTLLFTASNRLWAGIIPGATQYRFRFAHSETGFVRTIVKPNYVCQLGWTTLPLEAGLTYDVSVETFANGSWSGYCGPVCTLTIPGGPVVPMLADQSTDQLGTDATIKLWPNPSADARVQVAMDGLKDNTVGLQLFDLQGRVVLQRTLIASEGQVREFIELDGLGAGTYLLRFTVAGEQRSERLVLQR